MINFFHFYSTTEATVFSGKDTNDSGMLNSQFQDFNNGVF